MRGVLLFKKKISGLKAVYLFSLVW